ncbi:uncharacterized protein CcaverHIS019_0212540 [Cutaneotrichosporon cavernicola]|uniref:DNA replication regulator SLD2 n=1 Tax=Cutaneotrichosporon cavernicola TaxID=279322 RepID=A0AA48I5X1_9TREE|nr:uncharacterized protein CcaverHIS019_0212540 [Cutaneotrichosporon cavernicola]BEI89892.1 hypothetical protein CcaverHIS019_0212540 [Cutaneotrichosporon cavernicola]BEI97663.1 hypothetical protein CcaverHIS631_0212520 [Cutaneotrichosporon cavernicola]BEJ05440.1 hypothetical protein CcaverHIS641_0212570 [Cutaneotrichosporon cavernicola]
MDQLADVKAKVKAWERAFRRDNGRAPTKDDIRRGGEISEQYALWRKLSKEAEKHKANGRENGKHKAEEKAPRHDDHNTTPTPRRRSTARLPSPPPPPRLSEAGPSRPTPLLSTPKRRKLDDNPFSVSRQAPSPSMLGVQGTPKRQRFDYVHASSPKQLKSLLESARKSMKKDTPRTQARRWLSGEVDSPVHRKREFRGRQDAEEELGETPIKGEAFAILDDEPKGRDLFPIFRRAAGEMGAVGRTDKEPANGKRKATEAEVSRKKARASLSDDEEMDEDELAPTTPPTVSPLASRSRPTGERVLELTDDEFDPEASPAVVTIIGTRRTVVRISSIFDDDMVIDQSDLSEEEEDVEEDEAEGVELVTDDPRSMLSLLSLRSPIGRASEHMANLRVRALLDPSCEAAIALRAKRRGQDVFACGETGFEEEYLEIGAEVEIEGDDDWESDAEGWKADGSDEEW